MNVFVTGMGALTSLGLSCEATFQALLEGRSGVRAYSEWAEYNGLHSRLGAPVADYDVMKIPRQVRRSMSRMSEMGALATFQALAQADLTPGANLNSPRTLLIMGSTSGSPCTFETYFKKLFEKHGPEGQLSTSFFKVMNHSVAANVAAAIGYDGALLAPSSACATSTQALILGWEMIRAGLYDVVIAGGADELHYTSTAVFDIVQAASRGYNDRPDQASRPFDEKRDGLVVSEGAGVLILESEAHMNARGARPLARIAGGTYQCDGAHMTQSSSETMMGVIREALKRGGLSAKDVDYVNAHATSTVHGDAEEAKAIAGVFGDDVPVSSLKGHLGHSLAACGAIEAIVSIQMMRDSVLVPTRNLERVADDCKGPRLIQANTPVQAKTVLSNNFAFGGINTSLLLSSPN
ncbi:MAG TPA: beta-ketoacyl-[acyl-carrier-protein] synthase family protein [Bdellovibrionales bacterium]|nr:beta-ketoacyl-[acyl-carrier-protein] synthase family protein [Bdellovibrionales bacterium]